MTGNKMFRFLSCAFIAAVFLLGGCRTSEVKQDAPKVEQPKAPAAAPQAEQAKQKATGKVMAVSQKAGTISVKAKSGLEIFRFTDDTALKDAKSVRSFKKNEAVIVTYTETGGVKTATAIEKKLAKLPKGITEMKPEELAGLVDRGPGTAGYFLVDSRPAKRFKSSHIPTAVSIPVPKLKEEGAKLLPADKDRPLVFYCGGYT